MHKWLVLALIGVGVRAWAQAPAGNESSPMAKPPETAAAQTPAAVKVEKILVAASVENREPVGETNVFGPEFTQVTCWARLSVAVPPVKVKFVWSLNGKQVSEHPLDIKSSGRWWAAKTVKPGAWKVELQTEDGARLGSVEFKVGSAAAPAAQ